jgi:hydroxyacyl-ACP dehydratase HTD2-like protein with hotdog domain
MTRMELMKRLAQTATRPLADFMHQPVEGAPPAPAPQPQPGPAELFVWFEDTVSRQRDGRRGIAGLPESLLPVARGMRVVERRYAEGHLHLLSAVRLRCADRTGERIAAIYTAALSVGTIAWIGTGSQYEAAWRQMYPYGG